MWEKLLISASESRLDAIASRISFGSSCRDILYVRLVTDVWQTDDEWWQSQVNQNEEYNSEDHMKIETQGSKGLADRTELEGMKELSWSEKSLEFYIWAVKSFTIITTFKSSLVFTGCGWQISGSSSLYLIMRLKRWQELISLIYPRGEFLNHVTRWDREYSSWCYPFDLIFKIIHCASMKGNGETPLNAS